MAHIILNNLFNSEVLLSDIISWLTADTCDEIQWKNLNEICGREEFTSYFLNSLREQFTSILKTENTKLTPAKQNQPNLRKQTSCQTLEENPKNLSKNSFRIENSNQNDTNYSHQNSLSNVSDRKSNPKKRMELTSCSLKNQINPEFNTPYEDQTFEIKRDKSISFNNSSFTSFENYNSKNSCSQDFSNSSNFENSNLCQSNVSQNSKLLSKTERNLFVNNLTPNKLIQSPVSILQNSLESELSPIKHNSNKVYKDKFYQHNNTSTPEKIYANNTPTNFKPASRQNLCLGDFILTDNRGKKGSGKKGNYKINRSGELKDREIENFANSDGSLPKLEPNSRRRRINPTRLNISCNSDSKDNTVFGVLTRPPIVNSQFIDVLSTDKTNDSASFEVERGLLRLERKKNPENNPSSTDNKTNSSPHTYKILQKTPSKFVSSNLLIIPKKELVDNIFAIDILADLYSQLLDYNLVINPMSELYLIINLITAQYMTSTKKLLPENIIESNISLNKSEAEKNSSLRKSLNFDDLTGNQYFENDSINCNNLLNDISYLSVRDEVEKSAISEKIKNCNFTEFNENDKKLIIKRYFETPHNCVYFAIKVLYNQKDFLKCLDRATLKLLCENTQISSFQNDFRNFLNSIYSTKFVESGKKKSALNISGLQTNVCFQVDTDNIEKFPSSFAFSSFRKQRDMFYEIFSKWEINHIKPGWQFDLSLGGKIKSMLSVNTGIINISHLARLFTSQMLISCIQNEQQEIMDDESLSFLKNLKDVNPEKLSQLRERLVAPIYQNGPVPLPSFPGVQEFFRDFIIHAYHPLFYTHLQDCLIYDIMELNESQFAGSDIEESETKVDEQTKLNFITCLSSLKLLAKFLGFITALPYKSEISNIDNIVSSQMTLRSKKIPSIDLQYCLQSAIIQGKLSLTLPWIIEYLSMMDEASLRTRYLKKILEMLYLIYRASNFHFIMDSEQLFSFNTAILLKLLIGWLFELPIFPIEFYYAWQSTYNNVKLKNIFESLVIAKKQNDLSFIDADTSSVSIKHYLFLDKLDIIDETILYMCCPFLTEIKILLSSGNSNLTNSNTVRHITPVSSKLKSSSKTENTKYLEIQLEEAFFHGQPLSTKKTVEYVAERVSSSCIKYICSTLLSTERKKNVEEINKIIFDRNSKNSTNLDDTELKSLLMDDMKKLATSALKNFNKKCEEEIPKMCESRTTQAINSLLAEDCLQEVKNACIQIAYRVVMEKINQWIMSRIVDSSTFKKDMELEINRAYKSTDEPIINKVSHITATYSLTNILDEIRDIIINVLEKNTNLINLEILSNFADRLYTCLLEQANKKVSLTNPIGSLVIDLCLFLITYRIDLFTTEIRNKIFKLWDTDYFKCTEVQSILSRLLCSRNIMLMAQPEDNSVWIYCGKFLNQLLKKNILSIDSLSDQAVALFRQEWSILMLKNLSNCLKEAINDYTSTDMETERIKCLLEWISESCQNMHEI